MIFFFFAIHWHGSATGVHVSPYSEPLPASLPIPSLWVVLKPWLWVPCFMHRTCTALHVFASWCMFFACIELAHLVSFCFRYFDTILLVIYWVGLANNFVWVFHRIMKWKWKWKLLSCVRLCNPMDYKVHGILQAGILE